MVVTISSDRTIGVIDLVEGTYIAQCCCLASTPLELICDKKEDNDMFVACKDGNAILRWNLKRKSNSLNCRRIAP